jgi:hypothetical protein
MNSDDVDLDSIVRGVAALSSGTHAVREAVAVARSLRPQRLCSPAANRFGVLGAEDPGRF